MLSLGCELLIDRRFRLFWWRDARAAALTTAVLIAFFSVWDLSGIALGIFRIGESNFMLGIELAPHLPVEEPVFLALLVQTSMIAYGLAERGLRAR